MNIYEFSLVFESHTDLTTELEDTLFESGCDDALLSFRNGIAYLNFDREAESLESAILEAIYQVEQNESGLEVKRVEPSDLVTSTEIARRLNRSRQSVQQIISGIRGDGDFPLPVAGVTSKTMVWSWQEVAKWFLKKEKLTEKSVYDQAATLKLINESLEARRDEFQQKNILRMTKLLPKKAGELV